MILPVRTMTPCLWGTLWLRDAVPKSHRSLKLEWEDVVCVTFAPMSSCRPGLLQLPDHDAPVCWSRTSHCHVGSSPFPLHSILYLPEWCSMNRIHVIKGLSFDDNIGYQGVIRIVNHNFILEFSWAERTCCSLLDASNTVWLVNSGAQSTPLQFAHTCRAWPSTVSYSVAYEASAKCTTARSALDA